MRDRRLNPTLRARFEGLKADLLRRLERVVWDWPAERREAVAAEITRRRIRHEVRCY